jgi:hypothetical protein
MVDDKQVNTTEANSKQTNMQGELSEEDLERAVGGAAMVEYGLLVGLIAAVCVK